MSEELRHKTVAVAVIYDKEHGFLLWNNKRWGGYAFPMRHLEPGDDPAQAALTALSDPDFPLSLPNATASPIECSGAFGFSEGAKQDTYYDYHVIEIRPARPLDPATLDPELRFFRYENLQAATNVTWSTRVIATSLVEAQEVVVAVICRRGPSGVEFLLVHNRSYGYFFPAIRRKTHSPLEDMAVQAVRFDTSYGGPLAAKFCREVANIHPSTRFGARERRYRFYLCCVMLEEANPAEPGNALAKALDDLQAAKKNAGQQFGERGYWGWFTLDELHRHPGLSSDVADLLPAVAEAGEMCLPDLRSYQPKPIDTSGVQLSPEILNLTEKLADNAHDIWAGQRFADGWTYGPRRDDAHKKHPCLVPYAELPAGEKQYDRNAAMETLKAIIALGYRIEKQGST
jgi:ryanodine receptor 2